jgi:WD40 repeat protein
VRLGMLLALFACAAAGGPQLVEVEHTYLSELRLDVAPWARHVAVAASGCDAAWLVWDSGSYRAFLNGAPGRAYESLDTNSLVISPDGRRLGYVAKLADREIAVIDDRESRPYAEVSGICFSPDAEHVAFIGKDGPEQFLVLDWQELGPFDFVRPFDDPRPEAEPAVHFSADSRRAVYVTGTRTRGMYSSSVVVDGTAGPGYIALTGPVFGPALDASRIAYAGIRDGKWRVVIDGVETPAEGVICGDILLSRDGHHAAYVVGENGKDRVVLDGVAGPEYQRIDPDCVALSPRGGRLAYAAYTGGSCVIVLDGEEGTSCDGIGELTFSPDGKRFAYVAKYGNAASVVIDGEEHPSHADVKDLTFSPDSRRFAYRALSGTREDKVVVDGEEGPVYIEIGPIAFSSDSRHFAYCASQRLGFRSVVIDGLYHGPAHPAIISGPTFTDERTVAYLALHDYADSRLCRIKLRVADSPQEANPR